jgi:hypothetical protein
LYMEKQRSDRICGYSADYVRQAIRVGIRRMRASRANELPCIVCGREDEFLLLTCVACQTRIHTKCYDFNYYLKTWICQSCLYIEETGIKPVCIACNKHNGIMRKGFSGWMHAISIQDRNLEHADKCCFCIAEISVGKIYCDLMNNPQLSDNELPLTSPSNSEEFFKDSEIEESKIQSEKRVQAVKMEVVIKIEDFDIPIIDCETYDASTYSGLIQKVEQGTQTIKSSINKSLNCAENTSVSETNSELYEYPAIKHSTTACEELPMKSPNDLPSASFDSSEKKMDPKKFPMKRANDLSSAFIDSSENNMKPKSQITPSKSTFKISATTKNLLKSPSYQSYPSLSEKFEAYLLANIVKLLKNGLVCFEGYKLKTPLANRFGTSFIAFTDVPSLFSPVINK